MLEKPITIRSVELKNRLVMAPVSTYTAEDGFVSQRTLDHYRKRVLNSPTGLVITEHLYIDEGGRAKPGQLSIARDKDIYGLTRLVDTVHQTHSYIFAQISHAGCKAVPVQESPRVSASADPASWVIAMTRSDIDKTIQLFACAAQRARLSGFDGVEIHAAHGYLLNQFYSPLTNRRIDAYCAASIESRTLLHRSIIQVIRSSVGSDFPIAIRFGACDYTIGGSSISDGVCAATLLARSGADLLDISGGLCGYQRPGHEEPGYFQDAARAIKSQVSVPVLLTGGIKTRMDAEALLEKNTCDLIGIGRAIQQTRNWL